MISALLCSPDFSIDLGQIDFLSGRKPVLEAIFELSGYEGPFHLLTYHGNRNADGSVNLAHLLVGSEGTLAFTKTLTLNLAPLPRHKALGIVNFTSFHRAMDSAQHLVKLGPTAVELVDRTMVELALANPAFKPVMQTALIGKPEAILLVEFAGDDRPALLAKLRDLVALMGDLGLPGCVVEMPDEAAQKALWEVRKAGLNIMMSLKGDGKPVSFIEDCAVPLEHLADYTDALTEVFARHGTHGTWYAHASVGTLHVRPILDMRRDGAEGGAARMRAIGEEAAHVARLAGCALHMGIAQAATTIAGRANKVTVLAQTHGVQCAQAINVTTSPRTRACRGVPRSPTR